MRRLLLVTVLALTPSCAGSERPGQTTTGPTRGARDVDDPARAAPAGERQRDWPPPATSRAKVPVPAESQLGVADRGVFSDLDAKLQLPLPTSLGELTGVVFQDAKLLVAYSRGAPVKVYPVSERGEVLELSGVRVHLRAGDRAELAGRMRSLEKQKAEGKGAGDRDGDGIPDALDLLIGACKAALNGATYDQSYFTIAYPGGDVPRDKGACMDVIVRAARNAGWDIQEELQNDLRSRRAAYPFVKYPDSSIDHRRVRTALVYFLAHWQRRSKQLRAPSDPLQPGDVVFLDTLPKPGPDHVGILTAELGESGFPLVINNWTDGYTTQKMDLLGSVEVTHRFRIAPARSDTVNAR